MGKKTLILSQEQINEICGEDSTYLDGLAQTPDVAQNFANNVTVGGSISNGYAFPYTTDAVSHEMTKRNWGYNMGNKRGPATLNESIYTSLSKLEWSKKNLNEDTNVISKKKEHGNKALNNRNFSGRGYSAAKQSSYRKRKAEDEYREAINLNNKEQASQALRTIQQMNNNGTAYSADRYEVARNAQNLISKNKTNHILSDSSKDKNKTPENGVFTS